MIRALHICAPDSKLPNDYHDYSVGHIFVLTHDKKVQRMSFSEFLGNILLPPHTQPVRLHRMPTNDLDDFTAAEYEMLYNTVIRAGDAGSNDPAVYHAFRSCWFAAIEEVI